MAASETADLSYPDRSGSDSYLYSAVSGAGDSDLWSMIKDADYYTNIYQYFDVDDRIYKEIVMPWVDHPECQIPDSASHWMIYYAKEYKG